MTNKNDASHVLLEDAQELGHEARAGSGDHAALKLWLRMLASTTQIEAEIRRRLRERFDISLARFDYMAQLYRYKDGMKMRELSRYLMVTGGNVTGLTDDLEHEGTVVRESSPSDRRAWIVRLTPKGRRLMQRMLPEIRAAVRPVLLDGFSDREEAELRRLLNKISDNVRRTAWCEVIPGDTP